MSLDWTGLQLRRIQRFERNEMVIWKNFSLAQSYVYMEKMEFIQMELINKSNFFFESRWVSGRMWPLSHLSDNGKQWNKELTICKHTLSDNMVKVWQILMDMLYWKNSRYNEPGKIIIDKKCKLIKRKNNFKLRIKLLNA